MNAKYGNWADLDDDHRLAQALRGTGTSRLLNRVRNPRERAMSAHVSGNVIDAVHATRRWLADSVVTASWQSENDALAFLGDLYRDNSEPGLAARYYQRAGRPEKTVDLAEGAGDLLLPLPDFSAAPWWVLNTGVTLIAAQADLIDDASASTFLGQLVELAARGRRGELSESPRLTLTAQAAKSACALAGRGTSAQAAALLDLLAADVRRSEHQGRDTDKVHADACVEIAGAHPDLTVTALMRLFDLADQGVDHALELILDIRVLSLLGAPSIQRMGPHLSGRYEILPAEIRQALDVRLRDLSGCGHYLVPLIHDEFDPDSSEVLFRRQEAMDRILNRPPPDPNRVEFGTALVSDSSLVSGLGADDRNRCLAKLLAVAEDSREMASNRREALIAARNLVLDKELETSDAFAVAKSCVLGTGGGSRFDEWEREPHPLSSFKMNMGSGSLRGCGLRLAAAAVSTGDQHLWVREYALNMLHSDDKGDVQDSTLVLVGLPESSTSDIDADLLSIHSHVNVRQLAAVLCARYPSRYPGTLLRLEADANYRVRRVLAQEVSMVPEERRAAVLQVREQLRNDLRSSVRIAARGRGSENTQ
ncbi:hypothetical protein BU198_00300 [Streptomyces sp. CBMA156]|nr:hypothetical protein [Streptomyces sp. CBMA156]